MKALSSKVGFSKLTRVRPKFSKLVLGRSVADKKISMAIHGGLKNFKVGPAADHFLKVDPWWAANF